MTSVRVFFLGGLLSFRALFNWRHPSIYIPTMLGAPLFQILFFSYLGRYSGVADDEYFVVGNAVQASAMAGVYGMVMMLVNERLFGTLPAVLASPGSRLALYFGRTLPTIVNGLVVSAFGLGASFLLLDLRLPTGAVAPFAAAVAVTVASCAMFGLAIGSVGLRTNDLWFGSNLAYYVLLLLCGVNVPLSGLPDWLAAVGRALPLTHGVEAARRLAGGADLAGVAGLIGREALTGVAYAALGYGLLRLFEAESRRSASL